MLLDNFTSKNEYVITGISGGIDSMCLLDMLIKDGYKVVCAHVNHNQRLESKTEAEYLKTFCNNNNITFEYFDYKPKDIQNFQAVAHDRRYEFFYDCAKKYNAKFIVTAHHLDDQAETILLRLIKGSNLYGYGGISKSTPYKDITIYRPLLNYSREDINNYVKDNNIKYFEDSSNSTDHYLRNRIRHNILPLLKEENPNILEGFNRFSNILKDSFSFIRSLSVNYLKDNKNIINIESYNNLDIAIKKDIISLMLENHNIKPNYNLIDNIYFIITSDKPNSDVSLGNNYIFKKRYNNCYIEQNKDIKNEVCRLNLEETVTYNNYRFTLSKTKGENNAKTIKICYNYLKLPLIIRKRKDGDLVKFKFGTKKLNRLFIDRKLTREQRDNTPIITDSENNILIIYGVTSSSQIKEGTDTMYLKIEVNYEQ